ncbi:pentatricopeptide repeat-containing protein At1g05600 isoform X1 [Eucalyptus grandis]|uniref:Uncharacterized protein n=3 Tax=Eucalyptus grandis TaxID=71139 RepID=A0ACC3IXE9_EUCGR|nr:pentatricopeptide repeat-containing protein At1g05600 isoform X1 [Eucalyptus grandis]XP_010036757.1 pentatricopeptide repeat-containing protein At1g05600 isoform X1 [Eucalyptus grandis]XP_039160070.1 pentatricopeptide repeat-containing protein At1g05600 isoform X1 [Eucalyptus grandis]XP_039160071.1 pentatricopeptide repeat-containing protein At1g05600 isoform X1 [Eucalyptus grandis]KAK3405880.1 hypothetical protein EUGRSUZ_K02099 [Eucalyptus grandis]
MHVRWPRLLNPTQLSQILKCQKNPVTALEIFREARHKYPNYRHNGPVYSTIIGILANCGRISEMEEVINEMKEDSCECADSTFAAAINTYAKHGLLDKAVGLFRILPQFNCVNQTESFNALLQILVKDSRLEDAHHLFLRNSHGWAVKSRLRSLNLLMDALCQRRRSDLALRIFQEMDYQNCYPNRESYGILMRGLCEDGRLNEATHLLYSMFWRISQKGSGEDIAVYRTLLSALCDNGQVQEAVEIVRKILKKGLKALRQHVQPLDLSRCNKAVELEVMKRTINDSLITGGVPSSASYSAMAVDLYNEGKIKEAEKVLSEMRRKGFRPLNSTYEAKLAAFCRNGEVEGAANVIDVEMVEDNSVPTQRQYNILLEGLCNQGFSVVAVDYLEKMRKKLSCTPDKTSYEILLDGLCREGRFGTASKVLEQMIINSHLPHGGIFSTIIQGLCAIGRQYQAVMWLEEMVSRGDVPEVPVWNSLVSSVCCEVNGFEDL